MKMIIRLVTLGAIATLLVVPAFASAVSSTDTIVQDQCTQENKDAWYSTFRETFKTDQQPKAYEAAKKYLAACSEDTQITQYLKKWVTAYEKEIRKVKLPQLLYNDKNYAEAFKLGREILADEPENLKVIIDLGYGGYLASSAKNTSFNGEAINYARKAIQMIEAGQTPDNWHPFPTKDEALAFLSYYIGVTTLPQDPAAALPLLLKAARLESSLKKSPYTYDKIATAYEVGPYAKQSQEYKDRFTGQNESPEQKLALENINQIVDRMIDALARAVATAGADTRYQAEKKVWNDALTNWYKYRNKDSDAGLNEMVASILAKPLPPEPTPLTSLPVSAPATTPNSGNGTPGSNENPSSNPDTASSAVGAQKTSTTPTTASSTTSKQAPKRP